MCVCASVFFSLFGKFRFQANECGNEIERTTIRLMVSMPLFKTYKPIFFAHMEVKMRWTIQ